MDYTSDGDAELEAYGSGTYTLLLSGDMKVMNDEGLYGCPFCSDGKDDYNIYDLLQHALSVGAAHDQQAKVKVDHRALAKHLKNEPAKSLSPLLQPIVMETTVSLKRAMDWMEQWEEQVQSYNQEIQEMRERAVEHAQKYENKKLRLDLQCTRLIARSKQLDELIAQTDCNLELKKQRATQGFPGQTIGRAHIGIRMIGEVDVKAFADVCRQNFPKDVAEVESVKLCSKWQNEISNPNLASLSRIIHEKSMYLQALECKNQETTVSLKRMMEQWEEQLQSYNQEIQELRERSVEHVQKIVGENKKLRLDLQSMRHELDAKFKQLNELVGQTDGNLELEKQREVIREDDRKLQELKEEYGEEAYAAVTTALTELNEHSSSGR